MRQHTRFCTAPDGARIAYATTGAGPPLVRAGNWLTHLELDRESPVWRHWIEALSAEHTLLRYDLRGCGLSDRDVGDASLDTWVEDLNAVVEDMALQRFPLVGLCQGGAIAVAYAARYPQRVSRLVLYDAYPCGALAGTGDRRAVKEAKSLRRMIELGWARETSAFRELFANLLMPQAPSTDTRALAELQRRTASAESAARLWTAFHRLDVRGLAPRVPVPTLVLHVRGDCMVPFEAGRSLAGLIPNARFVGLDSTNHILRGDEPAWRHLTDEVRAFLNEDGTRSGQHAALDVLTRREFEVLELIACGHGNSEIARALSVSEKTVRNHASNLFAKLGVSGRAQAIVLARKAGLG